MAAKRSNAKSAVEKSPGKNTKQKVAKAAPAKKAPAKKAPAKKAPAKKAPAKKAPAKKAPAKKAPAKKAPAKKAPAKKAPAKKAPAKKAPAKKAPAKKAPAKKAPAKKAKKVSNPAPRQSAPAQASVGLGVGDRAPTFELPDQDGNLVSSSSLAGAPYVIYFYPKDDTPGCTKEACSFQAEQPAFQAAGVRVIGVSPDSPAKHTRFRAKYGLGFTLLSDADKQLAEAFGVWVMKQLYGREYMGIQRSTFLVDSSGVVTRAWRNVKVNGHVEAVLGEV